MIVFEIFFIIGLLMGIAIFMVTIQGLYRSWWLNGKPKPGKWYPIRWTEFKYRPGGNKNAIELLRPDHVVIQVPLKLKPNLPLEPAWEITVESIPYHGIYYAWTRQKATWKCYLENFRYLENFQDLTFKEFIKLAKVERVK